MSETNKEFYDLLRANLASETFKLTLTDNKEYEFKQLTTNHLKDLIESLVDSPLIQPKFNKTITKIFTESLVTDNVDLKNFNMIDRVLFCLATRIKSIGSQFVFTATNEKTYTVDLNQVIEKLKLNIQTNQELLKTQTVVDILNPELVITYGISNLYVEDQVINEFYNKFTINEIKDEDELRKVLGEAFINEIAKSLKSISINGQTLDLNTVSFVSRLQTTEELPAAKINPIIQYIESYRKLIDGSLTIEEGIVLPIDGSLFSLR